MINILGMTRTEALVVSVILAVIGLATLLNLARSEMLARDNQRKNDLKNIATALANYTNKVGAYPPSVEGKIANCGPGSINACHWGIDSLIASGSAVMERLPGDPSSADGFFYLYVSNIRDYQLYTRLENKNDDEYNKEIEKLRLGCGRALCNFGVTSSLN